MILLYPASSRISCILGNMEPKCLNYRKLSRLLTTKTQQHFQRRNKVEIPQDKIVWLYSEVAANKQAARTPFIELLIIEIVTCAWEYPEGGGSVSGHPLPGKLEVAIGFLDQKLVFKTNYCLTQIKSNAEGAFCNTFNLH